MEENSLKVSKALCQQSIISLLSQMGATLAAGGKFNKFAVYMNPRMDKALEEIENAQDVDKVIEITRRFTAECIEFMGSLFE